jgi:hypothetical protein
MASFRGLYYPYIHFQDNGWLKTAALYWDQMSRIVPPGTNDKDDRDVKELMDAGFIFNEHPARASYKIAEPFRQLIAVGADELQQRFSVQRIPDEKLVNVFDEKFDNRLLAKLLEINVAKKKGRWIGMHSRLADVYMTALAEAIAPDVGARAIADNAIDHIAISGLTLERLIDVLLEETEEGRAPFNREQEVEEAMVTVAFRRVIPRNASAIPVKEIIQFRKDYPEERGQFQAEVTKIIKELDYVKAMADRDAALRALQDEYDKRLKGKVERLEKGMVRANWDVVDAAMAASWAVPSGLAAGFAAWGLVLPAAAAGAIGVACAGWSIFRKRQKSVDDLAKPSAEAFLYRAGQLSPSEIVGDIYSGRQLAMP